ncbi:ABC transporter ATP-binding protein [Halomicroarcula sp. GCM10025710]
MQCTGVKKYYPVTGGVLQRKISEVKAVDNVDIRIRRGEIQGVVGESGCGKSTLARVLVNLNAPTGGNIYFDVPEETADEISDLESTPEGERSQEEKNRLKELRKEYEINTISGKRAKHYRQNTQFVFQNPNSSLNPRKLIRQTVEQPLKVHTDMSAEEREDRIADLLEKVGLGADFLYRYPHQLSGGQKQRVAIARAIATNPDFVVLDEPTSALDVSVQAQILNLLQDLQADLGLTYLFITHDLGVIRHMATDIAVMYLGKIVENASRAELFSDPQHPYTEALISSSPAIEMDREERIRLRGDVPDPQDRPRGCFFHTRCHKAESFCGWSGTDVLSIVQANVTKDPFVEELNDTLEDTEFDGYEASLHSTGAPTSTTRDVHSRVRTTRYGRSTRFPSKQSRTSLSTGGRSRSRSVSPRRRSSSRTSRAAPSPVTSTTRSTRRNWSNCVLLSPTSLLRRTYTARTSD